MINTVNLVYIHHRTQLHFFFPVMRTFKIYPLGDFQICNMILLTIVLITCFHLAWASPGSYYSHPEGTFPTVCPALRGRHH